MTTTDSSTETPTNSPSLHSLKVPPNEKWGVRVRRLLDELDRQANSTHGPDRYVIRGMKAMIMSNADVIDELSSVESAVGDVAISNKNVESAIHQVIQTNKRVFSAIRNFERSTNSAERSSRRLTVVGVVVALAQLILALVVWWTS